METLSNYLTLISKTSVTSIFGVLAAITGVAADPIASARLVTNGADDGPGSLRMALSEAAQSGNPEPIYVVTEDEIHLASTLTYGGLAPLSIFGRGQTIRSNRNETLMAISQGADLTIVGLNFVGPGGFSIKNRGDVSSPGGKGVFIDVRNDQQGMVHLFLKDVSVSDVAYHGIHISDCNLADECGAGSGGGGDGSPASIEVFLDRVQIKDVGKGRFDADGIRVDERGPGDIRFTSFDSTFSTVGADGVELDEGQEGDVVATISGSSFLNNGAYCAEDVLKPLLPAKAEADFDDGDASPSDIPGQIAGSPDDRCFQRDVELYPSGHVESYEFGIDFDDGLDIDEAGDGDLRVVMVKDAIRGNLDEGVDLDEEDGGTATLTLIDTTANGNRDDGVRVSEAGAGDVDGLAFGVVSESNGGNGIRLEEGDAGTLRAHVENTKTANNHDGKDAGLRMSQIGEGTGTLTLRNSRIDDGIDLKNVSVVKE